MISVHNCLEYIIIVKLCNCKNVYRPNVNNLWALKCCDRIVCNQLYMNNEWTLFIYLSKTVNFTVGATKAVMIWENVLYKLYSFLLHFVLWKSILNIVYHNIVYLNLPHVRYVRHLLFRKTRGNILSKLSKTKINILKTLYHHTWDWAE